MNRVFVDTCAWYALADSADADHGLAQLANDELLDSDRTFVTTNSMLAETITLLRYPLNQCTAVRFRQTLQHLIDGGPVQLVRASQAH